MCLKIKIILNLSIILILSGCTDTFGQKGSNPHEQPDENSINSSVKSSDWDYVDIIHGISVSKYKGEITDDTLKTPETIDGKNLIAIGSGFSSSNSFTKLDLSASIHLTKVENDAFKDKQIEEVLFPDSLTNIGDSSFANNQLTSVTLPNSVTIIGEQAFYGNQLTSVTLGDSLTTIGDSSFADNQLTSVTLPNSLTNIGYRAFAYNSNLKNVTFKGDDPSKVTIAKNAFEGAHSDLRIHVPKEQLQDYRNQFPDLACKIVPLDEDGNLDQNAKNINCGDPAHWTVTNTSGSLSKYTGEITDDTLKTPETIGLRNLTAIGPGFSSSNSFTKLDLSDSVHLTKVENDAFKDKQIEEVLFPNSLTAIGIRAFDDNHLTSVTLPNSLTNIGDSSFANNQLTSVTLPNSVANIGEQAFANNPNLKNVTFKGSDPSKITIPTNAFDGANSDLRIHVPKDQLQDYRDQFPDLACKIVPLDEDGNRDQNAKNINCGDPAHWNVTKTSDGVSASEYKGEITDDTLKTPETIGLRNLTTITRLSSSNSFTKLDLSASIHLTKIENNAFKDKQIEEVVFPDSLTTIGDDAFYGNQLTSVTLPNSLTTIGSIAFYRNQLTSVTLPKSLTKIEKSAFSNNQLTSVTLPNSVANIGEKAFANNQLTSVTLPNSLTTIGDGAFANNPNLKDVTFKGDDPSKITIAKDAFYRANSDLRIHVPKEQLQDYRNQFPDLACKIVPLDEDGNLDQNAKNINCGDPAHWTIRNTSDGGSLYGYTGEIKNNTLKTPKTIGDKNLIAIGQGFSSSDSFTKVDLSASIHLTTIGNTAFDNKSLSSVTLPNSLTTIGIYAFSDNQLTSVILPNSLTTIENDAFALNSNLKDVTFKGKDPSKVTISTSAFYGAHSDLRIHVPKDQLQNYRNQFPDLACKIVPLDEDGNLDQNAKNINCGDPAHWTIRNTSDGGSLYGYTGEIKNNTLKTPETIGGRNLTTIGPGFSSSNSFTKLDLSASIHLTTIGYSAFSENQLTSVILPNSLTTIGHRAFFDNQLTSVTLPDSLTTIGQKAFAFNELTSVTLPNSLTTIGHTAFGYNPNLKDVTFEGKDPSKITITKSAFYGASANLRIHVPKDTRSAYKNKLRYLACRIFELDANGNPQPESKQDVSNCSIL